MTSGLRGPSGHARRVAAIGFCALAAGCTMSYGDVLQRGHKYTSESVRKPPDVADCVAARMARQREWRLTRRPLDDRGSIELVVGSGGEGVAAIAHVYPSPYGSRIESWVTQRAVLTRDIWHEEFFGGC
jgi:hypothetical protein